MAVDAEVEVGQRLGPNGMAWLAGGLHALVDAASAAVIVGFGKSLGAEAGVLALLVVLYDVLAFGLQPVLGLVADRGGRRLAFAAGGLALLGLGVALSLDSAWLGAIVVAVGNAAFHVGAGGHVLTESGGSATRPGIFVAPGALGLWIGTQMGTNGVELHGPLLVLLWGGAALLWHVGGRPAAGPAPAQATLPAEGGPAVLTSIGASRMRVALVTGAVLALLCSVAVRALVGGTLGATWGRLGVAMGFGLAIAAWAGKAMGGLLADRFGWARVGVGSLLALAACSGLIQAHFGAGLAGMVAIQLAMPITLTAVYLVLPPRFASLAFGLTPLALLCGSLPGLVAGIPKVPSGSLGPVLAVSAVLLWAGLRGLGRLMPPALTGVPTADRVRPAQPSLPAPGE